MLRAGLFVVLCAASVAAAPLADTGSGMLKHHLRVYMRAVEADKSLEEAVRAEQIDASKMFLTQLNQLDVLVGSAKTRAVQVMADAAHTVADFAHDHFGETGDALAQSVNSFLARHTFEKHHTKGAATKTHKPEQHKHKQEIAQLSHDAKHMVSNAKKFVTSSKLSHAQQKRLHKNLERMELDLEMMKTTSNVEALRDLVGAIKARSQEILAVREAIIDAHAGLPAGAKTPVQQDLEEDDDDKDEPELPTLASDNKDADDAQVMANEEENDAGVENTGKWISLVGGNIRPAGGLEEEDDDNSNSNSNAGDDGNDGEDASNLGLATEESPATSESDVASLEGNDAVDSGADNEDQSAAKDEQFADVAPHSAEEDVTGDATFDGSSANDGVLNAEEDNSAANDDSANQQDSAEIDRLTDEGLGLSAEEDGATTTTTTKRDDTPDYPQYAEVIDDKSPVADSTNDAEPLNPMLGEEDDVMNEKPLGYEEEQQHQEPKHKREIRKNKAVPQGNADNADDVDNALEEYNSVADASADDTTRFYDPVSGSTHEIAIEGDDQDLAGLANLEQQLSDANRSIKNYLQLMHQIHSLDAIRSQMRHTINTAGMNLERVFKHYNNNNNIAHNNIAHNNNNKIAHNNNKIAQNNNNNHKHTPHHAQQRRAQQSANLHANRFTKHSVDNAHRRRTFA